MKYIVYAIFLTIPFANQAIVAGHLYLVDIPALMGMLLLPFNIKSGSYKLNILDFLVIIFLVLNMVSVVIGLDSLYESARYYRHMVLSPVLIYIVVRFSPLSVNELGKAVFCMLPGIFFQGVLLFRHYFTFFTRPIGVEAASSTVTLSVFFCISLFVLFWSNWRRRGIVQWVLWALLITAFSAMLLITFSRATIIGFILLLPITHMLWARMHLRKLFGSVVFFSICIFFVLLATGAVIFEKSIKVANQEEIKRSVGRVYETDLYLKDLNDRLLFWGAMTRVALEHPVFGSGSSSYSVSRLGVTKFQLGSSHNMLVSALLTSGLIGVCLLGWIIRSSFNLINTFIPYSDTDALGKILLSSFVLMLMVGLTNDLTGGRILVWFLLLSLISRIGDVTQQILRQKQVEYRGHD